MKKDSMPKEDMFSDLIGKTYSCRDLLDTETVLNAINGDAAALTKIIVIYEPYIIALSKREKKDFFGRTRTYVDETVKKTIETSLMLAIMKFDPKVEEIVR